MIAPKIHLTEARRARRAQRKIKKIEFLRGLRVLRASVRVSSSLLILFALLSCKTTPPISDIFLEGRLPLEPGGDAYLLAEKDALPLLSQLMLSDIDDKQFQQMIDLTRLAAAAVYIAPNAKTGKPASRYRLAAWGNYPSSRAKMALGSSKEWKKRRSAVLGADYWSSPQRGLSLAVTAKMALVAAAAGDEEPPDPFSDAPGTALPEGFAAFHKGSIFSCWLNNPGPALNQKIKEMGLPLEIPAQQIFIGLIPAEERKYTARLQIQLPGASQARALTIMFALARNFIPSPTGPNNPAALLPSILFANPPVQDGNNLNITTNPLSAQEIALLLKLFSL